MASDSFPISFEDFPEDVQVSILSFLSPAEISSFACTSRHFASLCGLSKLWFSMCNRRWGSKTLIRSWAGGGGGRDCGNFFSLLYKTLDRWESLIGFWRHIGQGTAGAPPLVFFDWGPSFITGSRVSPSTEGGSYSVFKIPFLWMGLSSQGEPVVFLHAGSRFESVEDFLKSATRSDFSDLDLAPATVSFMGGNHFVLEENRRFNADIRGGDRIGALEEGTSVEGTSPPDRLMSEIYQYFANRTSPGGDKVIRRQRKKREKDRLWGRRLESEHFVKIVNCYPTPQQPLQGLWKGVCEDMNLDFFLVTYDDVGGITCRKVGDASEPFSGYSPVFWTSNTTFLEPPFSREEEDIYHSRQHVQPEEFSCTDAERAVSHILCINSCYDLVIPGSSINPRNVEGRIWVYRGGTFGFGFLRNNYIVDLKHIALNGRLLDTIEHCCTGPSL